MAEIPSLYAQRPIVLRHQKAALYHPFVEALAMTIVDIPITFITTIVFGTILYTAVRLQETGVSSSFSSSSAISDFFIEGTILVRLVFLIKDRCLMARPACSISSCLLWRSQ